jgi:hypothetical protein
MRPENIETVNALQRQIDRLFKVLRSASLSKTCQDDIAREITQVNERKRRLLRGEESPIIVVRSPMMRFPRRENAD